MEANGDILAEMILDDIIRDTAMEMENLEMMERAEREAIRLQDNPTLENVFQRLEQMEVCSSLLSIFSLMLQRWLINLVLNLWSGKV